MICLSKADEETFRRSTWNQTPSPLDSKHTTRQDMNGISNLREHVEAGQADGGGGCGGGLFDSSSSEDNQGGDDDDIIYDIKPATTVELQTGKSDLFCSTYLRHSHHVGRSSPLQMKSGGDGRSHLLPLTTEKPRAAIISSWPAWLFSVVITALLINKIPLLLTNSISIFHGSSQPSHSDTTDSINGTSSTPFDVSSHIAISKRATTCGQGRAADKSEYNTPLHAGAVIIIWFVSTLSCVFPILAKRFPGLRIPNRFFFSVRHFGTGVLIATAFVHLLPTAFISLGDPCLGDFWTEDYDAMPGAIALAAIFFVAVIEMVFHPSRHLPVEPTTPEIGVEESPLPAGAPLRRTRSESTALPLRGMAPLHGSTSNMAQGLNSLQAATADRIRSIRENESEVQTGQKPNVYQSSHESSSSLSTMTEHKLRKERLQCVLLELGILFHSVFIGMALSVSVGSDFVVLLIAIVFHREYRTISINSHHADSCSETFEGLALGSRIATVKWGDKTKQPWLMAAAYGCT